MAAASYSHYLVLMNVGSLNFHSQRESLLIETVYYLDVDELKLPRSMIRLGYYGSGDIA